MRILLCGVLIALGLAACGGQEQNSYCPPPLGVKAEQLLLSIDEGLKAVGASARIRHRDVEKNECGFDIKMITESGAVLIRTDEQQNVYSLSAGYGVSGNAIEDVSNSLNAIQVITSLYGPAKLGELPVGRELVKTLPEVLEAARRGGGEAEQEILRDGYRFMINVSGNNVAIIARKK